MCGAFPTAGRATTTPLTLESACVVPAAFVAVMRASSLWPASAAAATWLAVVAPEMAVQPLPSATHRSHW